MAEAAAVLSIVDAFRASKAVFTAVSLGVFDRLERAPATAVELARATETNSGALERLLDACVALSLLGRDGERYRNLPVASQYLRQDSPDTLAGYILYSDRVLYRLWGNLEGAVREGTNRWEQPFGARTGVFENLFATEQARLTFLQGMHGMGLLSSPAVVASFDLSGFRHLCDLGGATGHLAIEACRRYPSLRATVFDLPPVTAVAQRFIAKAEMEARVSTHPGDFFTDPLPDADLYSLGRILHDWSEPKIRTLLAKIHAALPPGGGLLIAERLLHPFKDGPLSANLQSLNMLVVTEGKERTAAEYEALIREAGFSQVQARSTGRPLDAMLAIK
jgi:acetylserotonin N-methyltransferase